MNSDREQLIREFRDKEYRDSFVAEHIYGRLALKIRALREARGLSQKELGDKIGVAQTWVSKLEDPNYGKLTLSTLLRLASAFDVGIEVDFAPFRKVLDDALALTTHSWRVPSFDEEFAISYSPVEVSIVKMPRPKFTEGAGCSRRVLSGTLSGVLCKVPWVSARQWHSYPTIGGNPRCQQ
jgi:transcriptional regulator with XRE-family HTH domain